MIARLIMFDKNGKKLSHTLSFHPDAGPKGEFKLVLDTSTEVFPEWLFFFLRDHGAFIETDQPETISAALNLPPGEEGIVKVKK